jgi:glycogen(starch) synthase
MRIAYITQEIPPHAGGIASYIHEAAQCMTARGHEVEIFYIHDRPPTQQLIREIRLNLIQNCGNAQGIPVQFSAAVAKRHLEKPFDVLESPEYQAPALEIRKALPGLPIVVKLHTCSAILSDLNGWRPSQWQHWRYRFGSLRRGLDWDPPWWYYNRQTDRERLLTEDADLIVAPSKAIYNKTKQCWQLRSKRIKVIPLPFTPSPSLLTLPITPGSSITYFGRLEVRKGVLDLAKALPAVFRRFPEAKIRFAGANLPSDRPGVDMKYRLINILSDWEERVEFIDPIPRESLADLLKSSDICVFPSLWESFGYVCLEAMAAGQAVVASKAGGMAEILEGGKAGLLIPPRKPKAISDALCRLLADYSLQKKLRESARQRAVRSYGAETIAPLMEAGYREAINNLK